MRRRRSERRKRRRRRRSERRKRGGERLKIERVVGLPDVVGMVAVGGVVVGGVVMGVGVVAVKHGAGVHVVVVGVDRPEALRAEGKLKIGKDQKKLKAEVALLPTIS